MEPSTGSPAAHLPPPLADPGQQYRAARGIPVVPVFDGYRAYAIFGIVLLHLLFTSGVTESAGTSWAGQLISGTLYEVFDVFFIISGFVVFMPTVALGGRFGRVGPYALRRAARLLPALWLSLVAVILLQLWTSAPLPSLGQVGVNVVGQGALAGFFAPGLSAGLGVNGALWTLTPEIGFYVVLPFVAVGFYRRPLLGLAIAAAIAIGWRELFAHLPDLNDRLGLGISGDQIHRYLLSHNRMLPQFAFSFAAGMAGAWAYVRLSRSEGRDRVERLAPLVAAAGIAGIALFAYLTGRYASDHHFLIAPALARESWALSFGYTASLATAMVALAFCGPRLQAPFAHSLIRRVAEISYGVFLIHVVIIWYVTGRFSLSSDGSLGAFLTLAAIVVPLSLVYGYASARFLEQPIRRWAHRFGRRAESASPVRRATAEPSALSK